jgi:uncharacterized protein (DUF1499 family)
LSHRLAWVPGALRAALRLADAASPPPPDLGLRDGALRPCARPTNCVRSADGPGAEGDGPPPIPYLGTRAATERAVLDAVATLPGARVAERRGDYLRAECRSRVFRFVDDLELLFDDAAGVVRYRSASRVGRSDLGVNRRRVDALRAAVDARRGSVG